MNAPKLNPLKRDERSLRCRSSQVLNSSQTSARVAVCVSKKLTFVFSPVRFVAKRYILLQNCLKGQNMPARNTPVQLLAL